MFPEVTASSWQHSKHMRSAKLSGSSPPPPYRVPLDRRSIICVAGHALVGHLVCKARAGTAAVSWMAIPEAGGRDLSLPRWAT